MNKDQEEFDASKYTHDELVTLGTKLDGVEIIYRKERFPVPGTKAEKRAERQVLLWLIIGIISSIALFVSYLFGHFKYAGMGDKGYMAYTFYTPMLGLFAGIAILSIGFAAVLYTKKFIPEEIAVQDRHDGGSAEIDKKTTAAVLKDALVSSTLPRRKAILGALAAFGGTFGIAAMVAAIGGLVKNPWALGKDSPIIRTGWAPNFKGETVFMRRDTGNPYDVILIKPGDFDEGSMETVFPWRQADGFGDTYESREKLLAATKDVTNPVMLMRFRPEDTAKTIRRKGQENFNYGNYWAYTKICSHLGCPTSLFEQRTHHVLCPCHQSQFNALEWCKPIFGPAARPLAQLPITINNQGYFVAVHDFIEPVGPAFWERES